LKVKRRKRAKEEGEGRERRKRAKEESEGRERRKRAKEESEGRERRNRAKELAEKQDSLYERRQEREAYTRENDSIQACVKP
jgi:hypothetical protein